MTALRQARGAAARQSGRRAEVLAAAWLMLKGYRILGFRLVTALGEIDLLAHCRGLQDIAVRLDLIALAHGRRPRHLRDAWQEGS